MNTGAADLQSELVAALATPQRLTPLAASFGMDRYTMSKGFKRCASAGLVARVEYGCYAAVAAPRRVAAFKRPQPVQNAIMAFLTQERQAKEAARLIGRPVPNATGHLAAMLRLGLVVRTAYGRYHRSDLVPHDNWPAKITRPFPMRDAVQACLDRPMHYSAVADLIGRPHSRVRETLHGLAASGLAVSLGRGVLASSGGDRCLDHDGQRPVCAARGDAGADSTPEVPCTV